MAAIDKYYCESAVEASQLIKRFRESGTVSLGTFMGREYKFTPYNYLYVQEDEVEGIDWSNGRPLWNSPCYMDKWLWDACKDFPNVIEDLKWKYEIEDGMSEEEISKRFVNVSDNYKVGTRFKILKKCPRFLTRNKREMLWWVTVQVPTSKSRVDINYTKGNLSLSDWYVSWWHNERLDTFVPHGLPFSSNVGDVYIRHLHEKKILRIIRRYSLPVGSIVTFRGRYVGQECVIRVKE